MRVTGIGGVFFKAKNPHELAAWYQKHLGIPVQPDQTFAVLKWPESEDAEQEGATVWSLFPETTEYFNPSRASFMVNYRVANLDSVLQVLRSEGVTVDDKIEDSEFGRFGWIADPEGNRIELWEPPKPKEK